MAGLHRLFKDAFDEEVIQRIPKFPMEFKKSNLPDPKWQWADVEVQDAIFSYLEQNVFYFCYFLATHGCRPGEARALQIRDLNLETMKVTFQRAFSGEILRDFTKSKRIRTVPLDPSWVEMFSRQPRAISSSFIFTHGGLPLTEKFARHKWEKAAKRAGYPGLTLYQGTRHSFASQALNRDVPLNLISEFLGHSTVEQTRRTYAHLNTNTLRIVQRQGTVVEFKKTKGGLNGTG
jgi:integrase